MRRVLAYTLPAVLILIFAGFFFISTVSAQELQTEQDIPSHIVTCSGVEGAGDLPACNWCTFVQLIGNLIKYAIFLAVTVSSLMFAYAGFLLLTNNGSPGKVTAAWEIFRRAIYGIIGILAAWLIVNAIMTKVAGNEEWMNLECADVSTASADTNTGNPSGTSGGWRDYNYNGGIGEFDGLVAVDNSVLTTAEYQDYIAQKERERKMRENKLTRDEEKLRLEDGTYTTVKDDPTEFEYITNRDRYDAYCGSGNPYDADKCIEDLGDLSSGTVKVLDDLLNVCKGVGGGECNMTVESIDSPSGISLVADRQLLGALTTNISSNGVQDFGDRIKLTDNCGNVWFYNDTSNTLKLNATYSVPADAGDSCF